MYLFSHGSDDSCESAAAADTAFSEGGAAGAGDSVRSAFAFFFLADLDSAGTGGFWTSEAAMSNFELRCACTRDSYHADGLLCSQPGTELAVLGCRSVLVPWCGRLAKFARWARGKAGG